MKVVSVAGTQGSGKTTVIKELATRMSALGFTCSVIENESGEETYDKKFRDQHRIAVEFLRGG
ncbi:MAG: hypothetical protein FJY85_09185 [Deltaproteobacteria bacterium]|nr:hypothetical protein [Deltaproteobacteria bacterium]